MLRRARLLTAGLLTATAAQAQDTVPRCAGVADAPFAPAIERAREMAADLRSAFAFPGFAIAVAVDGRVVWSEGFGFADVERRTPACPTTRFRIGSVSKPITAAAALRLRDQGRMDIDAPVRRYVPELPHPRITTRMLASHLSGIRHYRGEEEVANRAYHSLTEALTIFIGDSLAHGPGARYTYSSYGYNLLGVAIERITGGTFEQALRSLVLGPLRLAHTTLDRSDVSAPERAQFYEYTPSSVLVPARPVDNSYKWPSGGLLSTVEDLARFGSALLRPGFLTAESLDLMFTSARDSGGTLTGYGFGFQVAPSAARSPVGGHLGSLVGGTAALFVDAERRVVVAFTANLKGAEPRAGTRPVPPPAFVELFARVRDSGGRQ